MRRLAPEAVAVPITTITVSLATLALHLGTAGLVGGAIVGLIWSVALGRLAAWAGRREGWWTLMPDATIALAITATGMLLGGGLLYGQVASAVLAEPSTTYATLSAMMQPTVPYYIALNTPLETLVVPLAVYLNWHAGRRRDVVVIAAIGYFAMRVWSYLSIAPMRFEVASRSLTTADVEWYRRTLGEDYRGVLVIACHLLFVLAAFTPRSRTRTQ